MVKKNITILFLLLLFTAGCFETTGNPGATFGLKASKYSIHQLQGNERGEVLLLPTNENYEGDLVFKTFKELNQLELVNQAGIRQQYIDQSVSLNLAFPSIAEPKWINKVHYEAWKKGIKTLYYMRTESVLRGDIAEAAMDENCLACDG